MNTAVKNIAYRTYEIVKEAGMEPLLLVLGSAHIEIIAILRCDRENVEDIRPTVRKPRLEDALKGGTSKHWAWWLSLAEWVLKLASLIETSNSVILKLQKDFLYFRQIMSTP